MRGRATVEGRCDIEYMRAALRLARRGKGLTSPNPAVGAVLVARRRVVGRGWHVRPGEAHAEVRAIERAGNAARGATLYVTLEPCCTHGRTPPCTDAIIRAGIRRVVVASLDPNPLHHGRGIILLRRRGIKVDVGVLAEAASVLNEDFEKHVRTAIPFTTIKVAMSLDGKIASRRGDSRWISGVAARRYAHRLRAQNDAILVGRRTVERDDPRLTVRLSRAVKKMPYRIVLDSQAKIPLDAKVLAPPLASRTIVAVTRNAPRTRVARIEAIGARVVVCPARRGMVSLRPLWRTIGRLGVMSVLVEGGGETIASVLEAGLVDKLVVIIAPKIVGGSDAPTPVGGAGVARMRDALKLTDVAVRRVGEDILVEGYLARS